MQYHNAIHTTQRVQCNVCLYLPMPTIQCIPMLHSCMLMYTNTTNLMHNHAYQCIPMHTHVTNAYTHVCILMLPIHTHVYPCTPMLPMCKQLLDWKQHVEAESINSTRATTPSMRIIMHSKTMVTVSVGSVEGVTILHHKAPCTQ